MSLTGSWFPCRNEEDACRSGKSTHILFCPLQSLSFHALAGCLESSDLDKGLNHNSSVAHLLSHTRHTSCAWVRISTVSHWISGHKGRLTVKVSRECTHCVQEPSATAQATRGTRWPTQGISCLGVTHAGKPSEVLSSPVAQQNLQRPYACGCCRKTFSQCSSLKRHKVTHRAKELTDTSASCFDRHSHCCDLVSTTDHRC